MNTKCKFFITAAGLVVSVFSATAVNAATTTLENIDVILEQQENTSNDKIRYISTLELSNNAKLSDITKIDSSSLLVSLVRLQNMLKKALPQFMIQLLAQTVRQRHRIPTMLYSLLQIQQRIILDGI